MRKERKRIGAAPKLVSSSRLSCLQRYDSRIQEREILTKSDKAKAALQAMFA